MTFAEAMAAMLKGEQVEMNDPDCGLRCWFPLKLEGRYPPACLHRSAYRLAPRKTRIQEMAEEVRRGSPWPSYEDFGKRVVREVCAWLGRPTSWPTAAKCVEREFLGGAA